MIESQSKPGTIYRLTESGGKKTRAEIGEADFFLQPLSTEDSATYEGDFSRGMKAYCEDGVDVRETDEIIIESQNYKVRSVQNFDFGSNPHLKLFLERPTD